MASALEGLELWMRIESNLHSIYPNFLRNLSARHGTLTEHEIKLCIVVLLKRSAGEIRELMGLGTVHSVHVSLSRLRHKLESGDEPLVDYLLKIAHSA